MDACPHSVAAAMMCCAFGAAAKKQMSDDDDALRLSRSEMMLANIIARNDKQSGPTTATIVVGTGIVTGIAISGACHHGGAVRISAAKPSVIAAPTVAIALLNALLAASILIGPILN